MHHPNTGARCIPPPAMSVTRRNITRVHVNRPLNPICIRGEKMCSGARACVSRGGKMCSGRKDVFRAKNIHRIRGQKMCSVPKHVHPGAKNIGYGAKNVVPGAINIAPGAKNMAPGQETWLPGSMSKHCYRGQNVFRGKGIAPAAKTLLSGPNHGIGAKRCVRGQSM